MKDMKTRIFIITLLFIFFCAPIRFLDRIISSAPICSADCALRHEPVRADPIRFWDRIISPTLTVYAEDMYSEAYYRGVDTSGGLSEAQEQSLDEECLSFMQKHHLDIALLAITPDRYEGHSLSEAAELHYKECGFGYGPDKDGFQVIWDTESDELLIEAYGAARDAVPEAYIKYVEGSVLKFKEEYGVYGPLYASLRFIGNYLKDEGASEGQAPGPKASEETPETDTNETEAESDKAEAELDNEVSESLKSTEFSEDEAAQEKASDTKETDPSKRVGEGGSMPAWYPVDPQHFPFYEDPDAARVVDAAGLFTDEEEASMEERLSEIRKELGRDIVVFTDVSAYGLGRDVYAADFYDFNGYGIGKDREGVVLFICMDPDDRGFWSCCTGPATRRLYTEEVANDIDDILYGYMVDGDYYEGVADWIENFRRIYLTGSPYMPDWTLLSESSFEPFYNAEAPRVVDETGILSHEELNALTARAGELSQKYDTDVVVYLARSHGSMDEDDFARKFFTFNGYGLPDDHSGLLFTIFKRPGYSASSYVSAYGKTASKLTEVNKERMESRFSWAVSSESDIFNAADAWLSQAGHMLKTGRAPRSAVSWGLSTLAEVILGLILASIMHSKAKKNMETPEIKENADNYLVPGSLKVTKVRDTFLNSSKTKKYDPVVTRSDSTGGSSSGRSSYSGSYSGSSGSSHSGSGRSF